MEEMGMSTAGSSSEKPEYTAKLIGYLSSCMIAAAFGSMLGTAWSKYWLIYGMFGLVSAIGLYVLSRSHARSKEFNKRKKVLLQAEKQLNKIVDIEQSFDAIFGAVQQIQADIADTKRHRGLDCDERRVNLQKPVIITPLGESAGTVSESCLGNLRNISSNGFSLSHNCSLERGYVLLEYALENHEPIQLIADLLWCERQTSGQYFSGGKFLELVNSADLASTKPDLAQTQPS